MKKNNSTLKWIYLAMNIKRYGKSKFKFYSMF